MNTNAAHNYRTQQIMTASPAQMVAMLFDRLLTSLREALDAIDQGDIERRWRANTRATKIVMHLRSTLDMEQGGEIAQNLDRLYGFAMSRLRLVDLRNDPAPAREVIQVFEPIRDSWFELARNGADAHQQQSTDRPEQPAPQGQQSCAQPDAALGGINLST